MASYNLGFLTGGRIHQYSNPVGQIYYVDSVANTTSYSIPNGFEDAPGDTWTLDPSKAWPQWNNNRTGRATLIDPNPPPPQTYLDDLNVKAALDLLVLVPDSNEHIYRRPMGGILRFIFPASEGYDIVQEAELVNTRVDFCTFKISRRPGGIFWQYEFMHVECKKPGEAWGATEDHLHDHLTGNGNDSKNCYGMIQIGFHVQYYKHEDWVFSKVGGKMHIITHAHDIINWGRQLKANPMSFV